jgi:ABC-2 type transport system permease protein
MWFSSVYLKTLRDYRVAILGWGLGLGLVVITTLRAFPELVATPEAKISLDALGATFSWLAEPVAITTPGGFATFRLGLFLLLLAIWPLLACSRLLRGEEERGSLDVLLSLPRGRVRLALEKLAALWTALLAMAVLIGLLAFAGGRVIEADFDLLAALLFGLNVSLMASVFGAIALLLSQFTQERGTASGLTGGLLLVSVMLDMLHRVNPDADWVGRFSPVSYYHLSKPLVSSYGVNSGALLVLVVLSVLLSGIAVWLFVKRDVGGVVALPSFLRLPERAMRPERVLPVNDWSLRSVYLRSLWMIMVPTLWWTVGIAGFASFMVFIVKQIEDQLLALFEGSPFLRSLISGGGDLNTSAPLFSSMFLFLPLLLMAFAVIQANRWAADEEDGRQELVLSTPQPRLWVLLARFAALTTATVVIGLLTLAATALVSGAADVKLDSGNLAAATLSMIPLGLLVAALGYLLSGWLRTAPVTGILSALVVTWFFISFLGPVLDFSDVVLRLSVFYYYGKPLVDGLSLENMLGLLAVAVVALALASVRFVRKDIAH